MGGITTRLHWTDQPYKWHVNDGEEVFAVLDGTVDMHYRENGAEKIVTLNAGAALYAANIATSIQDGIARAREAIASGAARRKLDAFVATTQKLGAKST